MFRRKPKAIATTHKVGFLNSPPPAIMLVVFMGVDMFSRRDKLIAKKQPIEIAFDMLMNAMIIAYGYRHNERFMPSENDLKLFDCFVEELENNYATAKYISRCLHQRSRGEAEGSEKTNMESFNYHFPKRQVFFYPHYEKFKPK